MGACCRLRYQQHRVQAHAVAHGDHHFAPHIVRGRHAHLEAGRNIGRHWCCLGMGGRRQHSAGSNHGDIQGEIQGGRYGDSGKDIPAPVVN
jgi:hypothetical protein